MWKRQVSMEFSYHSIPIPNFFLNEGQVQIRETEYLVQPLYVDSVYSMNTFIYLFKESQLLIFLKSVDSKTSQDQWPK